MPPSPLPPPRDLAPADDESALLPASDLDALRAALAGRYAIERPLGAGGMGSVWLGRDEALDRPVAIKVIAPELTASAVLRGRFLQEARTVARLRHPHIVQVYAAGEAGSLLWFAMEYVAGGSLRDRLEAHGALPPAEAAAVLRDLADALAPPTPPAWCTATSSPRTCSSSPTRGRRSGAPDRLRRGARAPAVGRRRAAHAHRDGHGLATAT
jgi:serine/threonine-protein kinase